MNCLRMHVVPFSVWFVFGYVLSITLLRSIHSPIADIQQSTVTACVFETGLDKEYIVRGSKNENDSDGSNLFWSKVKETNATF